MHYKSEAERRASINELLRAVLLVPRKGKERERAHNLMSGLLTETTAIHAGKMVELSHVSIYSGDLV